MREKTLNKILKKHGLWLIGDPDGVQADLRGVNLDGADLRETDLRAAILHRANLRGANLSKADLCTANLRGANLRHVDLEWADLCVSVAVGADLRRANLSRAKLRWANLREADLREAVLHGADLRGADLSEADLRGADLSEAHLWGAVLESANTDGTFIPVPLQCPERGQYIAFKPARGGAIVELLIPADALRSSATSRVCRANKATVVSVTGHDGEPLHEAYSFHDELFVYRVGETLEVPDFCTDRWREYAPGIHHFITREEAEQYDT